MSLYQHIYSLVREIPPGKVATYGQLARLVGTTARAVGFAMAALPAGSDVPWQRVVNSQGKISVRQEGEGTLLQYELLCSEGVRFRGNGAIDLAAYLFDFDDSP